MPIVSCVARMEDRDEMAFENTTTEQEMDAKTRQFVQSIKVDSAQGDPDLDIDGLNDSLLGRIVGLFSSGKP